MKYAIVESGGKQYKAVEGGTIEVDRLALEEGDKLDIERVLMVVDGEIYTVGTPEVDGLKVSATVAAHFKGPKIIVFKYHPKKRYRLKKGHRQQYTRLAINEIGKAAAKKVATAETAPVIEEKTEAKAAKPATAKKPATKKPVAEKTETAAKKPAAKKTETAAKKPAVKKTETAAKKPAAKKTETAAKKPAAKKTTKTAKEE